MGANNSELFACDLSTCALGRQVCAALSAHNIVNRLQQQKQQHHRIMATTTNCVNWAAKQRRACQWNPGLDIFGRNEGGSRLESDRS